MLKPFSSKLKYNDNEYWVQLGSENVAPKTVAKLFAVNIEEVNVALDSICKEFVLKQNIGNVFLYSILEVPKQLLSGYNWSDN